MMLLRTVDSSNHISYLRPFNDIFSYHEQTSPPRTGFMSTKIRKREAFVRLPFRICDVDDYYGDRSVAWCGVRLGVQGFSFRRKSYRRPKRTTTLRGAEFEDDGIVDVARPWMMGEKR